MYVLHNKEIEIISGPERKFNPDSFFKGNDLYGENLCNSTGT